MEEATRLLMLEQERKVHDLRIKQIQDGTRVTHIKKDSNDLIHIQVAQPNPNPNADAEVLQEHHET